MWSRFNPMERTAGPISSVICQGVKDTQSPRLGNGMGECFKFNLRKQGNDFVYSS